MHSLAARREVPGVLQTPLLVPSYSSRGFPGIGAIHRDLRSQTARLSLVSAYDIHHGELPLESMCDSDIAFLDSGGYEAYASSELSTPAAWSLEDYQRILDQIRDHSRIVPVTFDFESNGTIAEQVDSATNLLSRNARFPWDFLVKPRAGNRIVDAASVVAELPLMSKFAILGFAEDELGRSIQERLTAVARIRTAMNGAGMTQPIHIFGCLDPAMIPYYVQAGADIFDGLQWLRSVFRPEGQLRVSSAAIRDGQFAADQEALRLAYRIGNLDALQVLEGQLTSWIAGRAAQDLGPAYFQAEAFWKSLGVA